MNAHKKGSREAAFTFSSAPLPGLAASAAARLPRWALLGLVLLYIGHGLFHRDPWRGHDLTALAVGHSSLASLAEGRWAELLLPQMQGYLSADMGPLWPLLLALFMWPVQLWSAIAGQPMAIHVADDIARLAVAACIAIGLTSLWKSADRFARRREAQPLDPLGVGPRAQDFGKTLGDCALMLAVACLGVIYPLHQSGTDSVVFMLQGLALWSLATAPETPRRAASQLGWIVLAMLLTQGLGLAVAWAVIVLITFSALAPYQLAAKRFMPRFLMLATLLPVGWIAACLAFLPHESVSNWWVHQALNWQVFEILAGQAAELRDLRLWVQESLWVWWPLWPLALVGVWRVKGINIRRAPHWGVPAIACVVLVLLGLAGPDSWNLHQLAPVAPLALIAAFSLLSLSRVMVNLIDWFAVTLFTALGVFVWLYWTAINFGFPEALSKRVAVLAPGVTGNANVYEVAIGILATLGWITLVAWRLRRGSPRLWRPVVLSAGGLTLIWVLMMTLWLPAIDRIQGHASLARSLQAAWLASAANRGLDRDIAHSAKDAVCVNPPRDNRTLHAIALTSTRLPIRRANNCIWQLESTRFAAPEGWQLIWQSRDEDGRRGRERYVLFERLPQLP